MIPFLSAFLEEDQANLISLMLLTIPLSYSLSLIHSKYLKLAISIIFSVLFQSLIFPYEKYFLWAQQHIVYILLLFSPRAQVGLIVLFESFIFLTAIQLRRMWISYGQNSVDITGILMMQIFLYVGLAFNYANGAK